MDKKVRMADIAQQLGVSNVTVFKALSGKDGVSDELRTKIIRLAKDMGYVPLRTKNPKRTARATETIGILIAEHFFEERSFYAGLYRNVLVACNDQGYSVLMELVSPEAEKSCALPSMIQGGKVDGVIFMGEISRPYMQEVLSTGLPCMLLDFYDEELNADSVTSDNTTGGYRLTKHLLETGRTRIGFVGSIHATSSIMDRFLGYSKALLRSGIPINMHWVLDDRDEAGTAIPIRLPADMPQAFVCNNDQIALMLIEQLKDAGYRIPEDIAVAGYDDQQLAQFCAPPLTTYRVNAEDMGRSVVGQLLRKIKGKHVTSSHTVISGKFIKREST